MNRTANLDVHVSATPTRVAYLDVLSTVLGSGLDVVVAAEIDETVSVDVAPAFGPLLLNQSLDLCVAEGGAASQLFRLDTAVSTPLILGEHLVNDPATDVTFLLTNIDSDVVGVAVGPSATGVASISGFVNNGDGTASIRVDFDSAFATWELSVVVTDDVDNESAESPLFIVNSIERATFGEEFSIAPQSTVWTDTCGRMLDAIPAGSFTLKRQYTVPYSYNATSFLLTSVTPNSPVEIVVMRRDRAGKPDETQTYYTIPTAARTYVSLRLGRGTNIVTAIDRYGRSDTVMVAATTFSAVMCSYAREIYNYSQVLVDEQSNAIFSPVSTRLAEPLISFTRLLPDVRSQQTLAAKLAIRSLVSDPGRAIGVRDLLTALTLSTPIFQPNVPNGTYFDPPIYPLFNHHEYFGGVDAHVWIANSCVARWLAFVRYVANVFDVVHVSETEVMFYDANNVLQRHVFDLTAQECSLTTLAFQSTCFEAIDINVSIYSEAAFRICAATYPLDVRATDAYPIHPLWDEFGIELALDPGFDGYQDFSLTQHWDGGVVLDSGGAVPAVGSGLPSCVYADGYIASPLLLASTNAGVDCGSTIAMSCDATPARSASLDLSLDLAGVERTAELDIYVLTTRRSLSADMLIEATVTETVGLDVVISS